MIGIDWHTAGYEQVSKFYASLWKKLPAELVVKECRDVAIKALMLTKFTSKDRISSELEAPSRVNPKMPLKTILAAQKGITAAQLKRKRMNSANAVRAGWANGAKQFKDVIKGGGFIPRLRTSKKMGGSQMTPSNIAVPATVATGKIYNSFTPKNGGDAEVRSIQLKGLDEAKRIVAQDRAVYCKRKLEQIKNKVGAWK